jgi:hypothetical protein
MSKERTIPMRFILLSCSSFSIAVIHVLFLLKPFLIFSFLLNLFLFFLTLPFIQQDSRGRTSACCTSFRSFKLIVSAILLILFCLYLPIFFSQYLFLRINSLSFLGSFWGKYFKIPSWKRWSNHICGKRMAFNTHTATFLLFKSYPALFNGLLN